MQKSKMLSILGFGIRFLGPKSNRDFRETGPWASKTRNMYKFRVLLQKVELRSTFCNNFLQPATI